MSFGGFDIQARLLGWIVLLLSLTVHEWAHAWSAFKLGDDTASREGRLTLNPIAHIDPIGTVLLPLFVPIGFGWARPVPVNPARFRRDVTMNTGMMITAAAGPLANVVIAVVCALLYGLIYRFQRELFYDGSGVVVLVGRAIGINVVLAIFNMLPIPPLDGSRIVDGLLPYRYRLQWEQFTRFAPLLLLGVIIFGQRILEVPMSLVMAGLDSLVAAVAGW